jgi:hypothetical protein
MQAGDSERLLQPTAPGWGVDPPVVVVDGSCRVAGSVTGQRVWDAMHAAAQLFPTTTDGGGGGGDGDGTLNPMPWRLRFMALRQTLKPLLVDADDDATQWCAADSHRSLFVRHLGGGEQAEPLLPDTLDGDVPISALLQFAMAWASLEHSLRRDGFGMSQSLPRTVLASPRSDTRSDQTFYDGDPWDTAVTRAASPSRPRGVQAATW